LSFERSENPGNANLPIGGSADANREIGVPGRHEEGFLASLGMTIDAFSAA